MFAHVHSSIIHQSQKGEATQASISGWMDKQNVVHPDKEYYSERKEILPHALWVHFEDIMLSEISEISRSYTHKILHYHTCMKVLEELKGRERREWGLSV